ncbi:MAG TPA: PilZ domain-containing protein [Parvularculaceae bacterium]|nr:PilZ domain-containing protein [Parvularculaceae bacterium]HNS87341.1 PilZ domain-containing protein [Parvularculaceae bacterium]
MGRQNKPGVGKKAGDRKPDTAELSSIDERRASVRQPTFKAGEVILPEGEALDCVIRNVSENGCLIKIENAGALPDRISVRIDLDKPPRPAEVIWRSSTLAGAMFFRELS